MNKDTIYRQDAIKEIHKAIFEFFDICDDDEESPMTYQDKRLLELNKAITTQIKALPSAQPDNEALDDAYAHGYTAAESEFRKRMDRQPEIITCENCKHGDTKPIADGRRLCDRHGAYLYYCSDAERRTDEID